MRTESAVVEEVVIREVEPVHILGGWDERGEEKERGTLQYSKQDTEKRAKSCTM